MLLKRRIALMCNTATVVNVDFTYPSSIVNGYPVAFSASVTTEPSGVQIASYVWDFGDGGNGTGAVCNHIYASPGTYNVTLTVTTVDGAVGTITKQYEQGDYTPNISNGGPYVVGERIRLYCDLISGATYHWSGPPSWTSTNRNPTRPNCTLEMAGTHSCYVVLNGMVSPTATTEVVVNEQ